MEYISGNQLQVIANTNNLLSAVYGPSTNCVGFTSDGEQQSAQDNQIYIIISQRKKTYQINIFPYSNSVVPIGEPLQYHQA